MVAPLCRVARKNRESMDPRRNFAAAWVLFCEKQSLFNNQSPHTVADEHYLSAFPTLNQDSQLKSPWLVEQSEAKWSPKIVVDFVKFRKAEALNVARDEICPGGGLPSGEGYLILVWVRRSIENWLAVIHFRFA
ncbi:hypothetical protein GX50_04644 [[Emmonsia] crescens]|uniref:Uncharacterized protein n=1 Tax=[Emmonsia] crescens TaxID=73230 RepID=A0A2B7ZH81_9EURO|nr:hypothetical protein GX50_04644 [Emmonsia crescens]